MRPPPAPLLLLALLLAACGARSPTRPAPDRPLPDRSAQRSPVPPASPYAPRPATPAVPGLPFPECDPRAGDPDREHVALGLIGGDCQDPRGRNRVYVTRLATVKGDASPAARAGIKVGDRLVRIDSCEVIDTHGLAQQLRKAVPGWVARLVVERNGQELEVFVPSVRLAARSEMHAAAHLSTLGCAGIGRKAAQP